MSRAIRTALCVGVAAVGVCAVGVVIAAPTVTVVGGLVTILALSFAGYGAVDELASRRDVERSAERDREREQ